MSAHPGLVPQEKGSPTRADTWGSAILVDAATEWIKICLMQDSSDDSTLEAKNAFERDAMSRRVSVGSYHADNGRCAKHTFKDDFNNKLQQLTFCRVGVHHKNRNTEAKIKQLTLASRTMLCHAQHFWPEYISSVLWPFALLAAANRINNMHINMNGLTPTMIFFSSG